MTSGHLSNLDDIIDLWREKIMHFERENIITSDPGKKFEIRTRIKEIKREIKRLENIKSSEQYGETNQIVGSTVRPKHREVLQKISQYPIVGLRFINTDHFFKDRQEELSGLRELLSNEKVKFVCIVGRGGIGKTALVSKICAEVEQGGVRLPGTQSNLGADGILYFSCRGMSHPTVERIIGSFSHVLDPERRAHLTTCLCDATIPIVEKMNFLLSKLNEGRYLLVLDNLEEALDSNNTVADRDLWIFINQCMITPNGLCLLATSREPIVIDHVQAMRVVKLDQGLPESDGIALLRDLDPDGNLGIRDAPDELLATTVHRCFGIPKALEAISGILCSDPTLTLSKLLDNKALFNDQIVENLISEHLSRVTRDQRLVLQALAIFNQPVSREAVQYLIRQFFPEIDVKECLKSLVRNLFVTYHRDTETYMLHSLDQYYIYSNMIEEGHCSLSACHRRAAAYYELMPVVSNPTDILDIENQLRARQHYFLIGEYERAGEIASVWGRLLNRWGYYSILDGMLEESIQTTKGLLLAKAFLGKIAVYSLQNDWQRALEYNTKTIATIAEIPGGEERNFLCLAMINLSYIYTRLAQFPTAIDTAEKALILSKELGNEVLESRCISILALAAVTVGNYDDAVLYGHRSLTISDALPRQEVGSVYAHSFDIMGKVHLARGEYAEAMVLFKKALKERKDVNSKFGMGHSYNNLGIAYAFLGEYDNAIDNLKLSLAIRQEIKHIQGLVETYRSFGIVYQMIGQFDEALAAYQKSLEIAMKIKSNMAIELVRCQIEIGSCYIVTNETEKALDQLSISYRQSKDMMLKPEQAKSAYLIGYYYFKSNQWHKARNYIEEAMEIATNSRLNIIKECQELLNLMGWVAKGKYE